VSSYKLVREKSSRRAEAESASPARVQDVISPWLGGPSEGNWLLALKNKGDDGRAGRYSRCYGCSIERDGAVLGGWRHGCGSNLPRRCRLEAQFAYPVTFGGCDRRPKDTAGLRPRGVESASAVLRIKSGTRLVIRKALEGFIWAAVVIQFESAGGSISGKLRRQARPRCGGTLAHTHRVLGIFAGERVKTLFQPESIGGADGESSDAALGAAGTAEKMLAAPGCGVSKGSVHQSNECII
jgi:hypothetical protein